MACYRCFGFCVNEDLIEHGRRIFASKCVNCGNVVDLKIIENRNSLGNEISLENISQGRTIGCDLEC